MYMCHTLDFYVIIYKLIYETKCLHHVVKFVFGSIRFALKSYKFEDILYTQFNTTYLNSEDFLSSLFYLQYEIVSCKRTKA